MSPDLTYGDYAYYDYMLFRTHLICQMLERNMTLWLTESDATWFKDPTPLVLNTSGDMVTMNDFDLSHGTKMVQGGFWLLRPTTPTKQVWTALFKKFRTVLLNHQPGQEFEFANNEQYLMNGLVAAKTAGVKVGWLDDTQFVAGFWYDDKHLRATVRHPSVLLNNYIAGNKNKIARAKKKWTLVCQR